MSEPAKASKLRALKQLAWCINGPRKAGPKWVTYSREQAMAMLEVVKQLIELEGRKNG